MHELHLHDGPFNLIKNGTKTIEMRLYDEKRRMLKVGDIIEFTNRSTFEKIKTRVKALYEYSTFEELYEHFDKISLGYGKDEEANPHDMDIYYPLEEQKKLGVVAIEIELVK